MPWACRRLVAPARESADSSNTLDVVIPTPLLASQGTYETRGCVGPVSITGLLRFGRV